MTEKGAGMTMPHQQCSCSNHRQCALHKAEARKRARMAEEVHSATKVQVGIEELRRRYGKDVKR
jgi:hypothetical protein